ncbi:receptor-like protein Cf-9 [Lycium barbarum]|uniref:receptor-like protein Cf-9 n=1 Tax=Lycium barbarum TaxID=112863 RepID=UPI00293EFBA2|nr:receptor-like protein Cf-9 [Lycium barbarum]
MSEEAGQITVLYGDFGSEISIFDDTSNTEELPDQTKLSLETTNDVVPYIGQTILPHLCLKDESISLLKFSKTFTVDPTIPFPPYPQVMCDFYAKTSSWTMRRDCCSWDGVLCNELSGPVIELDISCSQLVDEIPFEISHLSELRSLHLPVMVDIGKLRLEPHDFKLLLQNLTYLREFDLNGVNISSTIPPNLSSHLTTLRLYQTELFGILPGSVFHLPKLKALALSQNPQLSGYFSMTKWNSSASLMELDLNSVNFSSNFPESFGYLTSLQSLRLRSCNLWGPIPESLSNITHIKYLFPDNNSVNGTIPFWIFSHNPSQSNLGLSSNYFSIATSSDQQGILALLCVHLEDFKNNSLVEINLGDNQLQGHLPKSIQNLVNLDTLDLSSNNFSGHVDVSFFSNLKHLRVLDLSHNRNSLTNENKVKVSLPKSLEYLRLAACEVKDLEFLRSVTNIQVLDLSSNNFCGDVDVSF